MGPIQIELYLRYSLPNRLGNNYTEAVKQNWHYLEAITEVIL